MGTHPGQLSRKVGAEVRALHTPGVTGVRPALDQTTCTRPWTGWRPGTTYYYGVGHDGFDPASPAHGSTVGSFRTAPANPEKFVSTAFGDQGVSSAALANDKVLLRQNPAFHLHAGDICYADGTGSGKKSDGFDPGVLEPVPQADRTGGEVGAVDGDDRQPRHGGLVIRLDGYGGQAARFSLPDSGFDPRTAPGVYSFTYGNVGVVALDANDVSYEDGRQPGLLGRAADEVAGQEAGELRSSAAVDFIVLFFHHCAYSTSAHASDGGVRAAWLPLFDKHQVDLVINGHNHVYQRTDAVKKGAVGRAVPVGGSTDPTRDGIVYVTAGGGGKDLYGFPSGVKDSYEGHVGRPSRRAASTGPSRRTSSGRRWSGPGCATPASSFLSVEAEAGTTPRLKVSALAESGGRIDHFEVRRGH